MAWRRAELYRLYKTAKSGAKYPSFHAFAFKATVDGTPVTFRIESDALTQPQFERAVEAARDAIAADMLALEKVPWPTGELRYVLSWNPEDDTWVPIHVF